MLRPLKLAALHALGTLGIFDRAVNSRWRRERLLILCYHGVSLEDEHAWDPELYLSPQQFALRMQFLEKANCHVLPLAEAVDRLYAHDLPPRSVAITFDDGFYDFYAQALPVLQQHGFPATVYLTTYYCDHAQPVFNVACRYILWKQRGRLVPRDSGFECDLDVRDTFSRMQTFRRLLDLCEERSLSGQEKHQLLEMVAHRLEFDFTRFLSRRMLQLLTPTETARLAGQGVDFQLHTHRHRTPEDPACFRAEIEDNRSRLHAMTGATARHFCYPSGVVQPSFLPWLRDLGVLSATTCEHGLADASTMPLLLPRRVDTSGASQIEFESWVCGVGALVSRKTLGCWLARRQPYPIAIKDIEAVS
ncbi:MAG: hypothetical protein C5B51_27515 [Terriglobia bacterium]|nr:MAG: hypothetical protein C5B51_27515 [Terriglobia bacterium]